MTKKILIITITVLVLALAGGGLYYFTQKKHDHTTAIRPVNDVNYDPPTEEEKKESTQIKKEVIEENAKRQSETPTPTTTSITIVRADQADPGAPLNVRTIVNGTSTGECSLEFTKSGQPTVTKTFPVIYSATYATCQSANIPASAFSASGEWLLTITVKEGTAISAPASQKVQIAK